MQKSEVNCIIDCRVSDKTQLDGGSLDDQEVVGRRLAERNSWNVIKVIKKSHSTASTDRDDLDEIEEYIKSSKVPIHHYIFKCFDRLTRAGFSEYERRRGRFEKLGVQVWDVYGIIQPKRNTLEHLGDFQYAWNVYSPSEAAEMLAAHQGKQELRDILTRLVGAEIRLVQEGYAVRRPPDGLVNETVVVNGKRKKIRTTSERTHYFQKMFQLRADMVDDKKIVDLLNAMGFRTQIFKKWDRSDPTNQRVVGQKGGKPLTVKQLQRYIQQTEFAGVIYEKWTKMRPVKAHWDNVVSVDVFNKANRGKIYIDTQSYENAKPGDAVVVKHNYSPWGKIRRLRNNPKYPDKWVLCPFCKSEMLASASRGKLGVLYDAYHCGGMKNNPKRSHNFIRFPKTVFEKDVKTCLESLRFDKGFLDGLEVSLIAKYREREKEIVLESSAISRTVSDLKAELAKKLDAITFTKNETVRQKLEDQVEDLDRQIKSAESQRTNVEVTEKTIRSFIRYAKYVMEHPAEIIISAEDLGARKALLSLFFEETPTYSDILNGTLKLTPLFKLSEEFKTNKSQLLTLRGVEPRFQP